MVPLAMKQAFGLLRTGRPGPVNIDVPLDVFQEETNLPVPEPDPIVYQRSPGDPEGLRKTIAKLLDAQRPVILAGQGVLLSEASAELAEFIRVVRIPVATSPNGKSSIDEGHDLALGSIGRNGTYAANEATKNADVILAFGCSFDDRTTSAWIEGYTLQIPPSSLIQIDIDPVEIGRNYPTEVGIIADAKAALVELTNLAKQKLGSATKSYPDWTSRLTEAKGLWDDYQGKFAQSDATPVRPERLMSALSRVIPENAIFATDVGVHHNWVVQLWKSRLPRHLLQSWGFAAMGYATSGILGAKLAKPDVPAVAVVGDGSFLMTPHVLATAVEYEIPAVWVVWNNYGYCSIRDLQLGLFKTGELATSFEKARTHELINTDFAKLAESMGVRGTRVEKPGDIEGAVDAAIKSNRPALVEVVVDREIRPVGTGTWVLPPLPHPEPNFLKLARGT
jgi:acetolactate synthase-1/2/3 large subunit